MTREEEIKNYAYNNCINDDIDDTSYSLIIEAAKWADETMIEKACEYLRTHLWQSVDDDNDAIVESVHNITLNNFIKDFKRYLKE